MNNQNKTKQQLIAENEELRRRLKELETPWCGPDNKDGLGDCGDLQWRSLVANTPAFIVIVDENLCIRFVNHTDSGASIDQVLGKSLYDFCQPEDAGAVRESVQQVFRTGKPGVSESRALRLDNQRHWYASHLGPIVADGRVVAVSIISFNISKQKQAETELATSQAILQAAIDSLPFDVGALGLDGRYMLQNAAGRANWGDTIGKLPEEVCKEKGDLAVWQENHRRALAGEKLEGDVEMTIRGEKRFCHHVTVPICDGGSIRGVLGVNIDVTEAKRAQDALKTARDELEQRVKQRTAELSDVNDQLRIFRMFAEASSQGVAMADLEGVLTYINPALCRMAGVARPQDAIGKHVSAYCPGAAVFMPQSETSSAPQRDGRWEGQLVSAVDGKTTNVLQNIFLIKDEHGSPSRLAAVITDITEQKRVEEALRTSEERFRSYFEQGLIGMAVSSSEKRWLEVNDRLCEILGYSRAELLGMRWTDLTHPDDMDACLETQDKLLTGRIEHYSLEKRFVRKGGNVVYAAMFVRCFRRADGTVDHILALIEDTTERKRVEASLRQSLDELRTIYDGMVDGIHILDLATMKPVRANSALCRMMGYSEEEVFSLAPKDVHPPAELPWIQERFQSCLEGRAVGAAELPLVRKDGSVFYADVTTSRILYNDVPCMMCFIRDATERRIAQQALERERQSLWRMLQASDHERQIISYEIHDGLAQYLAAARMQFQAHEAFRENSPDKAKKAYDTAIELVRQAHSEARRLISDVRPPVIDENGLETAISHLVHEQRQRGRPEIEFRSNVQFGRLPIILENSLYRIGQEALNNACKHGKSAKVAVALTQQGHDVLLEVQDWGIGFDPQAVEKGHFGLEGIRQRVRLLGGRLDIESRPGAGTFVQVAVPLLEKKDADSRPGKADEGACL